MNQVVSVALGTIGAILLAAFLSSTVLPSIIGKEIHISASGIELRAEGTSELSSLARTYYNNLFLSDIDYTKFYPVLGRADENIMKARIILLSGALVEIQDAANINRTVDEINEDYGSVYGVELSKERILEIMRMQDPERKADELVKYLGGEIGKAVLEGVG